MSPARRPVPSEGATLVALIVVVAILALLSPPGALAAAPRAQPPASRPGHGPITIRGIAVRVKHGEFTLHTKTRGDYLVLMIRDTSVTQKGKHGAVIVGEGSHVGVHGFVRGRQIRAISVRLYPTTRVYSLQGTVRTLNVTGLVVTTKAGMAHIAVSTKTTVRLSHGAGSMRDVHVGDRVDLRVRDSGNGPVAVHIHVYRKAVHARRVEVRGAVTAMGSGSITVQSHGTAYQVRLTNGTTIYVGTRKSDVGALRVGQSVRVYACCVGQRLTARSVHVARNRARPSSTTLRGRVMSVGPGRMVLRTTTGSVVVRLIATTVVEAGAQRVGWKGVLVNDHVTVRAYRDGGVVTAARVHILLSARRSHTLIGVIVQVSGTRVVVRTRGKQYTVVVTPRTAISFSGALKSVRALRTGDHVRVTGHLDGATVTAGSMVVRHVVAKSRTLTGTVAEIHGANLIIIDRTGTRHAVHLVAKARILLHNGTAPAAALFPGVRASARGLMSGSTLMASTVRLSVSVRDVKGRVVRVGGQSLTIARSSATRVVVDLPSDVTLTDGGRRVALSTLHAGTFVAAHGYRESSGRTRAVTIQVFHPLLDIKASVVSASGGLTIRTAVGEEYRVSVSPRTTISFGRENVDMTLRDIPAGTHVHVRGSVGSDGTIAAQEIVIRLTSTVVRGHVDAVAADGFTLTVGVDAVRVRVGSRASVRQGSHPLTLGDVVAGDDVTVYGYKGKSGVMFARRVLVHRKLVGMSGSITSTTADGFVMTASSGAVRVLVSPSTLMTGGAAAAGTTVHVTGYRRGDGAIVATRVRVGKKH